jgi:hypothetical protein
MKYYEIYNGSENHHNLFKVNFYGLKPKIRSNLFHPLFYPFTG